MGCVPRSSKDYINIINNFIIQWGFNVAMDGLQM